MPCYDPRDHDPKYICEEVQKRADAATRAACEMARKITPGTWNKLSSATRTWIKRHQAFDKREGR
jgi:hypothetical protein